jgi:hypothetical protein
MVLDDDTSDDDGEGSIDVSIAPESTLHMISNCEEDIISWTAASPKARRQVSRPIVNLENFDEDAMQCDINSPRSLSVCEDNNVNLNDLLKKPLDYFYMENIAGDALLER